MDVVLRCGISVHFFICLLIPAQQIRMAIFDLATAAIITALGHTVCTARLMGPVTHHAAGRAYCGGVGAASPPPKLGPGPQRALAPPPPPEMADFASFHSRKFAMSFRPRPRTWPGARSCSSLKLTLPMPIAAGGTGGGWSALAEAFCADVLKSMILTQPYECLYWSLLGVQQ
jgi:hypothetical protein